jgi:uncharacterized protein
MKRLLKILPVLLILLIPVRSFAWEPYILDAPRLNDEAGLLSESEEAIVLNALDTVSEKYGVDISIATVNGRTGSIVSFADDYYDARYGEDGVMLLIDMSDRSWYITTCGEGILAFTDRGIEYAEDMFLDYLSDGDYLSAFLKFAEVSDFFFENERAGHPIDVRNIPKGPFPVMPFIIISLAIGFVVAIIYVTSLKGQLKTVRNQYGAGGYMVPGSLDLNESRDNYIYSHVTRTVIQSSSSSSGGSRTHYSSSGRSHGGGGGHF